ncbi:MAG: alpha-ketoglutarate-dependent dioxygenase AlkB [Acidimicrobiia bacterium]
MVALQGTLLGADDPAIDESSHAERIVLDSTSWIDVHRDFLRGADTLLEHLADSVAWRRGRRWMYERVVDEPRLSRRLTAGDPGPHLVIDELRASLSDAYGVPFGGPFLNYYRDGRDSVAWHRDTEMRHVEDTRVAILTLGTARPFLLRPHGGGRSRDLRPGSGDLIVMGGACQRDWEHAVPKTARAGPRISVSVRWTSGRGHAISSPGRHVPRPRRAP